MISSGSIHGGFISTDLSTVWDQCRRKRQNFFVYQPSLKYPKVYRRKFNAAELSFFTATK